MNDIQIISNKIKTLPERPPFMLDSDLAVVYGATTRAINQAVKRNPDRFPEDFVFQLTKGEAESCSFDVTVCDIKKDGRGGRQKLPSAFTREGCNMLSAVLRTPVAIARSIQIMRAFTAMERGESEAMTVLKELAVELKELKKEVCHLKEQPPVSITLPNDSALPIALERKRNNRRRLEKALQYADVRELVIKLFKEAKPYHAIVDGVKEAFPESPEKHVSRSAAQRFCDDARRGRLKEYGIDVTYH